MDDLQIFKEITRIIESRETAAHALVTETTGSSPRKAGAKMVVYPDGRVFGSIGGGRIEAETIEAALVSMTDGQPRTLRFSLTEQNGFVCGGSVDIYVEPIVLAPRLLIVGAGHIGRALANCSQNAGYDVVIIDPYGDHSPSPASQLKQTRATFSQVFEGFEINDETCLLIATRSHEDDFIVVEQALRTEAGYIGLLGSKRKKAVLLNLMEQKGFNGDDIERIVTPVGLDIAAQTPAEIAVSITAQLIQFRRNGVKDS